MRVERLRASAFRCYARVEIEFADGVTAIVGPNGAGKTSLLEAVHFGCLAWSPRTTDEARLVADGEQVTRVEVSAVAEGRPTEVAVGFRPGPAQARDRRRLAARRRSMRSSRASRSSSSRPTASRSSRARRRRGAPTSTARPPAAGPPPRSTSREFTRALSQRNHLLAPRPGGGRERGARSIRGTTPSRRPARPSRTCAARLVDQLEPAFAARLEALGGGPASPALVYRPHGPVDAEGLRELLRRRRRPDIERALTGAGPQHDDIVFTEARDVRTYGSQGEQRSALLALVLAEADTLTEARGERPLLLLDDVASELDRERRGRLLDALAAPGQTLLTTTQEDDLAASVAHTVAVRDGALVEAA